MGPSFRIFLCNKTGPPAIGVPSALSSVVFQRCSNGGLVGWCGAIPGLIGEGWSRTLEVIGLMVSKCGCFQK